MIPGRRQAFVAVTYFCVRLVRFSLRKDFAWIFPIKTLSTLEKTVSTLEKTKVLKEISKVLGVFLPYSLGIVEAGGDVVNEPRPSWV